MGTSVAIEAAAATEALAVGGIEAAYQAIADAQWRLHPARDGSDLASLNSAAPRTPIPVADATWQLLRLTKTVHGLSDGAFDPCLPSRPGRLVDLALSPPGVRARSALCRMPLALDLGGIAKGYAIDRAIDALHVAGCVAGLVNAGGDLRVYGRSENVLLRRADRSCEPLTLKNAALAVTDLDVDAAQRPLEHQGYYHYSEVTFPAPRFAAIAAPSAAVADALTKCVLFAEPRCAERALHAFAARRVG
jgi:thiamine biosynthesis lipoprotein